MLFYTHFCSLLTRLLDRFIKHDTKGIYSYTDTIGYNNVTIASVYNILVNLISEKVLCNMYNM